MSMILYLYIYDHWHGSFRSGRAVCLSICPNLSALSRSLNSFVHSFDRYMRFPYHIWRRRSAGLGPAMFFAAFYCGLRPQRRRSCSLAAVVAVAVVATFLSRCFCFRCRRCVRDYSESRQGEGRTEPATAINNKRHAAASVHDLFFLFFFLFFGPPLPAPNLHQQLYALLLHRRFMLPWVFCVLRFALLHTPALCPCVRVSVFRFPFHTKNQTKRERESSIVNQRRRRRRRRRRCFVLKAVAVIKIESALSHSLALSHSRALFAPAASLTACL